MQIGEGIIKELRALGTIRWANIARPLFVLQVYVHFAIDEVSELREQRDHSYQLDLQRCLNLAVVFPLTRTALALVLTAVISGAGLTDVAEATNLLLGRRARSARRFVQRCWPAQEFAKWGRPTEVRSQRRTSNSGYQRPGTARYKHLHIEKLQRCGAEGFGAKGGCGQGSNSVPLCMWKVDLRRLSRKIDSSSNKAGKGSG